MILEHVAIWTKNLEMLKDYYVRYFNGVANEKYHNSSNGFESYFITFKTGARLEIMSKPGIPANKNDTVGQQHEGLIHLAFGVDTMMDVDELAARMKSDGLQVLRGPRKTGDGYYEFETLDPDNNRIEVTTNFVVV